MLVHLNSLHTNAESCAASFALLTSEVKHEAGLSGNDPLGSRLAEDGDVVLRTLAECCQTAAQLKRRLEDVIIGEPTVLTKDHLQGAPEQLSVNVKSQLPVCE